AILCTCAQTAIIFYLMHPSTIRELYLYNHWANQRTLASIEPLSVEEFTRAMGNSFSSVRDTLAHILGAEWIWLERWLGRSPRALLSAADFPTLSGLRARWETVEQDRNHFLEALTPERLQQSIAYINLQGKPYEYLLWQQMLHVVNHSSYHRGQIVTLLRQLGRKPENTDFLLYYDLLPKP
ncbi:MAG TPA: DinB family protein, partial [Candidatus Angelobacter sp.]|nr:DinB family protein [Candidatus Angelobacter sp.]